MDAISFVLGVRSSSLRSAALKDLIYRSGKKSKAKGKGKAVDQDDEGSDADGGVDEDEEEGEEGAEDEDVEGDHDGERRAWVMAVYIENEKEWKFQRS